MNKVRITAMRQTVYPELTAITLHSLRHITTHHNSEGCRFQHLGMRIGSDRFAQLCFVIHYNPKIRKEFWVVLASLWVCQPVRWLPCIAALVVSFPLRAAKLNLPDSLLLH